MTSVAARVAAFVVLCASYLAALALCVLFLKKWREKGSFTFFSESARNHPYLTSRSQVAWLGFAIWCLFDLIVLRIIVLRFVVWHNSLFGSKLGFLCFVTGTHSVMLAITVVRCWRLRVRHMYYVVLRNADWAKLMDPSVEDSLSFWLKYKAILTSERGVLAAVLLYIAVVFSLMAAVSKNMTYVRVLFSFVMVVSAVASLLLLYRIPHSHDCLKRELQVNLGLIVALFLIAGIMSAVLGDIPFIAVCNQSLVVCCVTAMFVFSFYVFPRRVEEMQRDNAKVGGFRQLVFEVFQSVELVTAFATHCSEVMCVENVLAILEIAAFKKMIRSQLVKDKPSPSAQLLDRISSRRLAFSHRPANDNPQLKPIISRDAIKGSAVAVSTVSHNSANEAIFRSSLSETGLGLVCERWSRWDLKVSVELSQFGCRSAIVSGTGDLRSKALSLCEKYFEWDSKFSLNISSQNRSNVLNLVGKDASVALEPVQLLYAFDGAMHDVELNLQDAMCQFRRKTRLSKSVLVETKMEDNGTLRCPLKPAESATATAITDGKTHNDSTGV